MDTGSLQTDTHWPYSSNAITLICTDDVFSQQYFGLVMKKLYGIWHVYVRIFTFFASHIIGRMGDFESSQASRLSLGFGVKFKILVSANFQLTS